MAYIPEFVKLSKATDATLNALATDIGTAYGGEAPVVVKDDLSTLKAFGKYITSATVLTNAFLDSLVNRIVKVLYTGQSYHNSLALFKKGIIGFGEVVEDVFVAIVEGAQRNEDASTITQTNTKKIAIPDVKTAFYMSNVRCNYSVSIRKADIDKAFTSFEGVNELIERIIATLIKSHNYDEYILTKVKLLQMAKAKDNNVRMNYTTDGTPTDMLTIAREIALNAPFFDTANIQEVDNTLNSDDLCIVIKASTEANIDVNALASAFNLDKAEFIGKRVTVNDFSLSEKEQARLKAITGLTLTDLGIDSVTYPEMIICSKNALQIWDTKEPYFTEDYNGLDDVRTYHLHVDQAYAINPFENFYCVTIE